MSHLQKAYQAWLERVRAAGLPLISYACPRCDQQLETARPAVGAGPFDSLSTCICCEGLHYRAVWSDGRVMTSEIEIEGSSNDDN